MGPKGTKSGSKPKSLKIYKEGDHVVACDQNYTSGGQLYDGIIVRVHKVEAGEFRYYIHYQKWKRKYDVWMSPEQIALASDPLAVKKLTEGQQQANKKIVGGTGKTTSKSKDSTTKKESGADSALLEDGADADAGTDADAANEVGVKRELSPADLLEEDRAIKRNKAVLCKSDLSEATEAEIKVMAEMDLPLPLKRRLVKEWSLICEKEPRRLLKLPRPHTIKDILKDYLANKETKDNKDKKDEKDDDLLQDTRDFAESLSIYFDRALPVILLYRHERKQYDNAAEYMRRESLQPSEVYGAEHLNRLFIKMSKLLFGVVAKREELADFRGYCQDLMKFISKHSAKYFVDEDYKLESEALAVAGVVVEEEEEEESSALDVVAAANLIKSAVC
jgi:mortality factor 4-like protein 1